MRLQMMGKENALELLRKRKQAVFALFKPDSSATSTSRARAHLQQHHRRPNRQSTRPWFVGLLRQRPW